MPKEFGRHQRVAQFIKEELSVLVQRDFPLNQYGMITLVDVDLSPDLKNATIHVTALNNNKPKEDLVADMNDQASHFRHELSKMLTTRGVPTIRFKYDESIERAQRLTDLINSVSQTNPEKPDE
jgi:ribosome-binding factor A